MTRKLRPLAALAIVALIGAGCLNEPDENGSAAITISLSGPMPIIWIMREHAPDAGSTPSLFSVRMSCALREAMRKSQEIAISTPPPAHTPFTAAMTGFSSASISSSISWLART